MLRATSRRALVAPAKLKQLSMKQAVVQYGMPVALYYWISNEVIVCILTYCLHFGYFGKEDLVGFLERIGASKYVKLDAIETKSWSFFGGRLEFSARLVANFVAASLFMTLWTPIQVPICVATYPALRAGWRRLRGRRATGS